MTGQNYIEAREVERERENFVYDDMAEFQVRLDTPTNEWTIVGFEACAGVAGSSDSYVSLQKGQSKFSLVVSENVADAILGRKLQVSVLSGFFSERHFFFTVSKY